MTSAQRSALLPLTPTVAELGVTGYELNQWHGLLAPAATPESVLTEIREAVGTLLADAAMRQELASMGYDLPQESADAFAGIIRADLERFGHAAREIGLAMN